jgi:TRAP-type mannitol/chloroaromatic compound transport system permease small subunit
MKFRLGIVFVVIGVLLLLVTIPYSIIRMISSITELEQGQVSGGIPGYLLIIGVVLGFVLIIMGATEIYFKK